MPILVILYTAARGGSPNHFIYKAKEVGSQSTNGVGTRDAR